MVPKEVIAEKYSLFLLSHIIARFIVSAIVSKIGIPIIPPVLIIIGSKVT